GGDKAFQAAKRAITHTGAASWAQGGELGFRGFVASSLECAYGVEHGEPHGGDLNAESDQAGNAACGTYGRERLIRAARLQEDVPREHRLIPKLLFLIGFIQGQVHIEALGLQVGERDAFLPWSGIGQVPRLWLLIGGLRELRPPFQTDWHDRRPYVFGLLSDKRPELNGWQAALFSSDLMTL